MVDETLLEIVRYFKVKQAVSGTELAKHLGITRTAVWKKIQKLESLGYLFDTKTKVGYKLIEVLDILHPVEILTSLKTKWFGRPYFYYEEISSTNDKVMALASEGFPEGTLVIAESQTKGRGRLGRNWISLPKKGLYFSFLLRPPVEARLIPQLTLISALTMIESLEALYGVDARLKWPNDIVINGKKLAGILAEAQVEPQRVKFVVIGIGLNVFYQPEDFIGEFRYLPTSLSIELATEDIRRQDIVTTFGEHFESNYSAYLKDGFLPWLERLREKSMILNKKVVVTTGNETISGEAIDFSEEGGIIIRSPSGINKTIWVGDVEKVSID